MKLTVYSLYYTWELKLIYEKTKIIQVYASVSQWRMSKVYMRTLSYMKVYKEMDTPCDLNVQLFQKLHEKIALGFHKVKSSASELLNLVWIARFSVRVSCLLPVMTDGVENPCIIQIIVLKIGLWQAPTEGRIGMAEFT